MTSPALSPDGRLLAFLRGPGTFTSIGQIWIKSLPDGDAVPLTDDDHVKMGPAFSPDGSRIAYTVPWDTWEVPVAGGQPRLWLPNASGLTWIDEEQILFSEIETGLHIALTAAPLNRRWSGELSAAVDQAISVADYSHLEVCFQAFHKTVPRWTPKSGNIEIRVISP